MTPLQTVLKKLKRNQRKGSKPRCHLLTHGTREIVAGRLTSLIAPWGRVDPGEDQWMPGGFQLPEEAQLGKADRLIEDEQCREFLTNWWLAVQSRNSNTPNWDIACTCTVREGPALILIEAKAHDLELIREEKGKTLKRRASSGTQRNHEHIGARIDEASRSLADQTGLPWVLSRDHHYQMSNRFAWSWKVTELGFPVILIYLGFLNAEEMRRSGKKGRTPFADAQQWKDLVTTHSEHLFPREIWNREWKINNQSFIPLIRASNQPLAMDR
jgi:hypothetical protein